MLVKPHVHSTVTKYK